MAENFLFTGADALRVHLTGAGSHLGAQSDPWLSSGGYVSSTEAVSLLASSTGSDLANVAVSFASGANGPGDGALVATGSDSLAWQGPGESGIGPAVTVPNGASRILRAFSDRSKYVRVSRSSATGFEGQRAVSLLDSYDNAIAQKWVTSAEATAGVTRYSALALRNLHESPTRLRDLRVWLAPLASVPERVSAGGGLGSSGAGSITIQTGTFEAWPRSGWALVVVAATGVVREMVYYSSRNLQVLTVPSAGRALGGTSAAAGATSDRILPWHGVSLAFEEPSSQPGGAIQSSNPPTGLTWMQPYDAGSALYRDTDPLGSLRDLKHGEWVGLWFRWHVPAGAVGQVGPGARVLHLVSESLW